MYHIYHNIKLCQQFKQLKKIVQPSNQQPLGNKSFLGKAIKCICETLIICSETEEDQWHRENSPPLQSIRKEVIK